MILETLEDLKRNPIKQTIDQRIKDFQDLGNEGNDEIFKELCFCFLTSNFNAERAWKMQTEIGDGFISLPREDLASALKRLGHRFPNARSNFIVEARKHKDNLKDIINQQNNEKELRNWLVGNVKGLGYKEASHFLRNIGFRNLAIIDFHIIDFLVKNKIIRKPKYLTKKKYLYIEEKLRKIADKTDLNLAELDLYLWYLETGKVLK